MVGSRIKVLDSSEHLFSGRTAKVTKVYSWGVQAVTTSDGNDYYFRLRMQDLELVDLTNGIEV